MSETPKTPGQVLDASLGTLATKDDLRAVESRLDDKITGAVAGAVAEIVTAINGGIDQLRQDLNTEFARHKIPVKLATRKKTA